MLHCTRPEQLPAVVEASREHPNRHGMIRPSAIVAVPGHEHRGVDRSLARSRALQVEVDFLILGHDPGFSLFRRSPPSWLLGKSPASNHKNKRAKKC